MSDPKFSVKETASQTEHDSIEAISVEISGPRLELPSGEKLYHWLLEWFSKNAKDLPHSVAKVNSEQTEYGKMEHKVFSLPGFGIKQKFQYKGQWIQLERIATSDIQCQMQSTKTTYEKIVLSSTRQNRNLIYELLDECKPAKKEDEKRTPIYVPRFETWSRLGQPRKRRPLSSVILCEETKNRLLNDVKEFKASEQWYVDRGIPYRRGYLLYGPPGCGKTSIARSLAGEINCGICILSLTVAGLDDHGLNTLMNSTPDNCIVLLEDIDAAFRSREDQGATTREQNLSFEGAGPGYVTFGGLLNALDGAASSEGRMVFMTTNYVDRLDPALVRPGRVDMKLMVDYPNDDQLAQIFGSFYPEVTPKLKTEFVKKVRNLGNDLSMAAIQGLFMFHKEDPQAAINQVDTYFKEQLLLKAKGNEEGLYN